MIQVRISYIFILNKRRSVQMGSKYRLSFSSPKAIVLLWLQRINSAIETCPCPLSLKICFSQDGGSICLSSLHPSILPCFTLRPFRDQINSSKTPETRLHIVLIHLQGPSLPHLRLLPSPSLDPLPEITSLLDSVPKVVKYNLRKPDDPFQFTLMDADTGHVRRPTEDELAEFRRVFPQFRGYRISRPYLILEVSSRPDFAPVTVAGLATIYTERMYTFSEVWGKLGNPAEQDFGTTEFSVPENTYPPFHVVDKALLLFQKHINGVVSLRFHLRYWVVELNDAFDVRLLPGKFARRPVRYIPHSTSSNARQRLCTPGPRATDETDYRMFGLAPGVKVAGESMSSSAGVLVEHPDGRKRLTLANRGFYDTSDCYHPDSLPSFYLGRIEERYAFNDIALCDIVPTITFSNRSYFTANPPTKFLDAYTLERYVTSESWFEVEGLTTGRVFLLYSGPGSKLRNFQTEFGDTHVFDHQLVLDWFGPENMVRGGICGAPVVHQPAPGFVMDGATVGFYFWDDGRHAIVPTLDRFIDEGWRLSQQ